MKKLLFSLMFLNSDNLNCDLNSDVKTFLTGNILGVLGGIVVVSVYKEYKSKSNNKIISNEQVPSNNLEKKPYEVLKNSQNMEENNFASNQQIDINNLESKTNKDWKNCIKSMEKTIEKYKQTYSHIETEYHLDYLDEIKNLSKETEKIIRLAKYDMESIIRLSDKLKEEINRISNMMNKNIVIYCNYESIAIYYSNLIKCNILKYLSEKNPFFIDILQEFHRKLFIININNVHISREECQKVTALNNQTVELIIKFFNT
jgi:hypothetical protein